MVKIIKIQVQNTAGQPMAGQAVDLTGSGERATNPDGNVQFLSENLPNAVIKIGGVKVWTGSTADLKPQEIFKQAGAEFVRG